MAVSRWQTFVKLWNCNHFVGYFNFMSLELARTRTFNRGRNYRNSNTVVVNHLFMKLSTLFMKWVCRIWCYSMIQINIIDVLRVYLCGMILPLLSLNNYRQILDAFESIKTHVCMYVCSVVGRVTYTIILLSTSTKASNIEPK